MSDNFKSNRLFAKRTLTVTQGESWKDEVKIELDFDKHLLFKSPSDDEPLQVDIDAGKWSDLGLDAITKDLSM